MRPISRSTTMKPSYCQLDDATLYVSLELSQANLARDITVAGQ